jgi:hypothetical protein
MHHKKIGHVRSLASAAIVLATLVSACGAAPESEESTESVDEAVTTYPSGKTVVVRDAKHFCLFLPKHGQRVANSETSAHPYCTVAGLAPGAATLPKGAVTAHEVKTANFIQITGKLDDTLLGLHTSDQGGQFDDYKSPSTPHGSPSGAACEGYKYFVEQVEPNAHRYCIRCCNTVSKSLSAAHSACVENHSSAGCTEIMPGADFN